MGPDPASAGGGASGEDMKAWDRRMREEKRNQVGVEKKFASVSVI